MVTECIREIDEELEHLTLLITIDLRQKNPVVSRYVRKLRAIVAKIREIQKHHQPQELSK